MWDYDFFGGWQYIFKKVRYVFIRTNILSQNDYYPPQAEG